MSEKLKKVYRPRLVHIKADAELKAILEFMAIAIANQKKGEGHAQ